MESRERDRDLIEFPMPKSWKTDSWWAYKCWKLQLDVRIWSVPLSSAVCHISQSQCFDWHVLHVKCFLGVFLFMQVKNINIYHGVFVFVSYKLSLCFMWFFYSLFRLIHFIECILIYSLVLYSYRLLLCLLNHLSVHFIIYNDFLLLWGLFSI